MFNSKLDEKREWSSVERKAKARNQVPLCSEDNLWNAKMVVFSIICAFGIFLVSGCNQMANANEYTDEEIVNAIYKAEGGEKAQYPYGIRSIPCSTNEECRRICLNTVRKNRARFASYGHKRFKNYLAFLASRYCPTSGNLSNSERNLNKHWLKNVTYFLEKGRS